VGSVATRQAVLDRLRLYVEAMTRTDGREGWRQARELVNELRSMGDPAVQALMQVLAGGGDSEERRAAARLLGSLQAAQALPALQEIFDRESDVLLRRAAASGLRQMQTPESLPLMHRILSNPAEDRIVRLSAAYGLAEAGQSEGVAGLSRIFAESTADGRGRDMAFRALAGLSDERSLPFMRDLVNSAAEPSYRLRAIHFVAAQRDRQALSALRIVMQSPQEQPSIRDAAAQAYATLSQ
jgi:HEAT repeat protein